MTSGSILQLVSLAVVVLASNQLAKRKREVDSDGNPTLRNWSTCFLGFMAAIFFLWMTLKNLGDPFHQRYPENTAVEMFFCVFGFSVAAWGYYCKITLTRTAITCRYLPFLTRVYLIESVESVESKTERDAVIRLSDGRKIAVVPFYSGGPYFLENLGLFLGSGDA
jgi:hypothetical protein